MPITIFDCFGCKDHFVIHDELTTGYGIKQFGKRKVKLCYDCIAKAETGRMLIDGANVMYLTKDQAGQMWVSNWPASLKFVVYYSKQSRHACFGYNNKRHDVWFVGPDGFTWHGIQRGNNNDICRVKRTKQRGKPANLPAAMAQASIPYKPGIGIAGKVTA
jgi:hypothetical protein